MNRIPVLGRRLARLLALVAALGQTACQVSASQETAVPPGAGQVYQLEYVVRPDPPAGGAWVTMRLSQSSDLLREVDMRAPAGRISDIGGDGDISLANGRLTWDPPATGGSLRWFAGIAHRRGDDAYDAYIAPDWAIFRAEDVIPQAATRTLRGALSETTLRFELPAGWSSLTEYFGRDNAYAIRNENRRFDRPAGWILLGKIGVRRDRIAGINVSVAAPTNHGMRRIDILALLNWTLPEVLRIAPDFPKRLTIMGADDPMWRGGLSGPRSLFLHADRPLISENATSTLLHEVMHIALGATAEDEMDWILEGLAEYYSLKILQRSGSITDDRFSTALRTQADWGAKVKKLCRSQSSGPVTARAVTIMRALDKEISTRSKGSHSLDDVFSALAASDEPVSLERLIAEARPLLGQEPAALQPSRLPGCRS